MIEIMDYKPGMELGWRDGKLYLRSGGGARVRVFSPTCNDIPAFAFGWKGAPARPQHKCSYCGKVNTVLVNGKFCNKCGTDLSAVQS